MQARFQRAAFLTAASSLRDLPPDSGREVAFAGRSNAGKSSAINALCHQTRLARTSKTPGRTQQLIFFALDDERRLVDLPGYGFARVSKSVKEAWQALMGRYLQQRTVLQGLVVVMDIRHPLTDFDRQMLDWGEAARLPMLLLLTKADKLKRGAVQQTLLQVRRAVDQDWTIDAHIEPFSATSRLGLEAVQQHLSQWLYPHDAGDNSGDSTLY
ncbi:YihA family ribosome biogenesis GTP-binding protein [Thiohalocapsa marina]|uniref:Probable GTP-binding protein EngB n=1 Tax=Thiohalocapsa marina TaxID=424902 RepID=A0A5M8FG39_9GAMM|nr:ribosome biogenesis GTP-binding protein YihA/YsxC [Thiohalocapsa marina]KAA6183677.1 YihA family ribosome biogenesis GTP-binding protein [Thiohalocapsa marina]